jgi:hypothetical protein
MAKAKLVSMSIEDLLKLRDEIGRVLRKKTEELKQQLAILGNAFREAVVRTA